MGQTLYFTGTGVSLWNGANFFQLIWNSPTLEVASISHRFGLGLEDVADVGITVGASMSLGLQVVLIYDDGTADVGYGITLSDIPGLQLNGPVVGGASSFTNGGYSLTTTGSGDAGTFDINLVGNITAYLSEIGFTTILGDATWDGVSVSQSLNYNLLHIDAEHPLTFTADPFSGFLKIPLSPALPTTDANELQTGFNAIFAKALTDAFAGVGLGIDELIFDLTGVPLTGGFDAELAGIDYTILDASLYLRTKLVEKVRFEATGVDVHVTSTLGQTFDGKAGDTFAFDLPIAGYGSFDVTETYILHGNLFHDIDLRVEAGIYYKLFGIHLYYDVGVDSGSIDEALVEDDYVFAHADIPLYSSEAYDISSYLAPMSRTYTVSWERFYVGTDGDDVAPLTPHQVTYDGGKGNDTVTGNALDNVIDGGEGDDHITGGLGADTLHAGSGQDTIDGEGGDDIISGGAGGKLLIGGEGDDTITVFMDAAERHVHGDLVTGNLADTSDILELDASGLLSGFTFTFAGPDGDQVVAGSTHFDGFDRYQLIGSAYDDVVTGWVNGDELRGAGGNDHLNGAQGDDVLRGGEGGDTLRGDSGDDTLYGDDGADDLDGGLGLDHIYGGEGADTIRHHLGEGADVIDGGFGYGYEDIAIVDAHDAADGQIVAVDTTYSLSDGTQITDVERLTFLGSAFIDVVIGGGAVGGDLLQGADGDDRLDGGEHGADSLLGQAGDDTLTTHDAATLRDGGEGFDRAVIDRANGVSGFTLVHQDAGGTGVASDGTALSGIEVITFTGSAFADTVTGTDQGDSLSGGAGADVLDGWKGDDTLIGGTGSDILRGGDGNDTITETEYADTRFTLSQDQVYGGDGNDTILVGQTAVIVDGGAGDDVITIRTVSAPFTLPRPEVTGGAGSDTILGSTWKEHLVGGADDASDGADSIDGAGGDDWIQGGGGADVLTGGSGNDIVDGQSGDDRILMGVPVVGPPGGGFGFNASDGDDSYSGGAGYDTLDASLLTASVTIDLATGKASGSGTDTLSGFEAIIGGQGNDVLRGDGAANAIDGGLGEDVLHGGAGDDTLRGGSGGDYYFGDAGNDLLIGWTGAGDSAETFAFTLGDGLDTIQNFNVAQDRLVFTGKGLSLAKLTLTAVDGGVKVAFTALNGAPGIILQGVSLADMQAASAAGRIQFNVAPQAVTDKLSMTAGHTAYFDAGILTANDIDANKHNLLVTGVSNVTGGTVTLIDGKLTIDSAGGTVEFDYAINDGFDAVDTGHVIVTTRAATEGADVISGLPTYGAYLMGLGGNDTLTGTSGRDTLIGGDGNDILNGGLSYDVMIGGAGDDIYTVNDAADVVTEDFFSGTDQVKSAVSWTLGDNVENLLLTGAGIINGTGNVLDNVIEGNAAANTLTGDYGDDTLKGMAGNDILLGGSGNDRLDGGAGADQMTGGDGDDSYVVDNIGDTVSEAGTDGDDLVTSSLTFTLGEGLERLTLTGSAAINGFGNGLNNTLTGNTGANQLSGGGGDDFLVGGAGNDTLTGGEGNDSLDGGAGVDIMTGGAGNDNYTVSVLTDQVIELANGGTDTVLSAASYTLTDNVENLTLTGLNAIIGTGNGLANIITGNDRDNILKGMGGDDVIIGGLGADKMYGGSGDDIFYDDVGDTVIELAGEGFDTVRTLRSSIIQANIEVLQLIGTADINATGNPFDNTLIGNAGLNRLEGREGNDHLISFGQDGINDHLVGGAGNDLYETDEWAYTDEEVGGGIDTLLQRSVGAALQANVENLIMGEEARLGNGNELANDMVGNGYSNLLNGNDGNDRLAGGGGEGDLLHGGAGQDVFIFKDYTVGVFSTVVDDFVSGTDRLDFSAIDAKDGVEGNDAFHFIGQGAFTHHAGELHAIKSPGLIELETVGGASSSEVGWYVEGDINGDGVADFMVFLKNSGEPSAFDFIF